jgi:hypothetical protein
VQVDVRKVNCSVAVQMMRTGDLNPHFFDYPAFYIYLLDADGTCCVFLAGAMRGEWSSRGGRRRRTEAFYVLGLGAAAALGTATVVGALIAAGMRSGTAHGAARGGDRSPVDR